MKIIEKNGDYYCLNCQNNLIFNEESLTYHCPECGEMYGEEELLDDVCFIFGKQVQLFKEDTENGLVGFINSLWGKIKT